MRQTARTTLSPIFDDFKDFTTVGLFSLLLLFRPDMTKYLVLELFDDLVEEGDREQGVVRILENQLGGPGNKKGQIVKPTTGHSLLSFKTRPLHLLRQMRVRFETQLAN